MTKSAKTFLHKLFSVYIALTLTFSHLSPFLLFASQVQAAPAQDIQESLQQPDTISYNSDSHSLEVTLSQSQLNTTYALFYENDEAVDAATGQSDSGTFSIFLGSQSSEDTVKSYPERAILKVQAEDTNTVITSQLEIDYSEQSQASEIPFIRYETSDFELSESESLWLTNGVHRVSSVDVGVPYEYPLNNLVSVTFTELPEEGGSLHMAEVALSDEQVTKLSAVSSTAYEITSSMENGTFKYDLTLPNPTEDANVTVQYSEDGEHFSEATASEVATEQKDGNNLVRITGLDHFTVFVVVPNTYTATPENMIEIIVDNSDPDFNTTGSWSNSTGQCAANSYEGNGVWASNTGEKTATWQFEVPAEGEYRLYVSWAQHNNQASNALYTVHYGNSETDTFVVNQKATPNCEWSDFQFQETYTFNEGETYSVVLSNADADGNVFADAIKLVHFEDQDKVWVNDDWVGSTDGDIVGDNYIYGFTAYSTIQSAIDSVANGGEVFIYAGEYEEQVAINNKSVNIVGEDKDTTRILSPDELTSSFNAGTGNNFSVVEVTDATFVDIKNITIDGAEKGASNSRFIGLGAINSNVNIENVVITNVRNIGNSGAQHGLGLYVVNTDEISRTATINNIYVSNYQKNGITVNGSGLTVDIQNSTVTGYGEIDFIAQNGIQVSRGAAGYIANNTISNNSFVNPSNAYHRASACILLFESASDLVIQENIVSNCDNGIYGYIYDQNTEIIDNVIDNNYYGITLYSSDSLNALAGNIFSNSENSDLRYYVSGHDLEATNNTWSGSTLHEMEQLIRHNCEDSPFTTGNCNSNDYSSPIGSVHYAINEPPVVTLTSIVAGEYYSGDIDFLATVVEQYPEEYRFLLRYMHPDGGKPSVYSTGWVSFDEDFADKSMYVWDSTTSVFGDGKYRVRLDVRDQAGNNVHHLVDIHVDNTAPSQPVMKTIYKGHDSDTWTEIGCSAYTNDTQITIEWEENPESDIAYYWFGTKNNPKHRKVSADQTMYMGNMTPGNNPYYYTIIAVDHAGNESKISEPCGDLILDQVAPVTFITQPADGEVIQNSVELVGNIIEENLWRYFYRITDSSGTTITSKTVYADSLSDETFYTWDTTTVPDGEYTIHLAARDKADNRNAGSQQQISVIVDNEGPEISEISMIVNGEESRLAKPGDTIRFSAIVDDAWSDVDRVRVISRKIQPLSNDTIIVNSLMHESEDTPGLYFYEFKLPATYTEGVDFNQAINGNFFRIRAWDDNGNRSMTGQNRFTIDSIAPQSTITGPGAADPENPNTIYVSDWDGSVTGTASDTAPGQVAGVELEISRTIETTTTYWDGSEWSASSSARVQAGSTDDFATWNYQIPTPFSDELTTGTYTVTSRAYDTAGNKENSSKLIIVLDREIPEVGISVSPTNPDGQNNWYKTRPTVTLTPNESAVLSGIKRTEYSWNSQTGPWTEYTAPFQIPGEGAYVLYYRTLSNSGNYSDPVGVKNLRWDETTLTQGPLNVSANPSRTSGTTSTISWDAATDNIGIDRYEIIWKVRGGGPEFSKSVSGATTQTEIDRMTEEGEWEVFVRAYDPVGNMKEGVTLVTVVQTAPAAPTLELAGTSTGTASLTWNAVENASRYIVYYGINSGEYIFAASVGNTTAFTVEGLAADTYYFMVRAVDDVDNQSSNSNEVTTGAIAGAAGTTPGTGGTIPAVGFEDAGDVLGDEDDAEAIEYDEEGNQTSQVSRDGQVAGATDENCTALASNLPWILFGLLALGAVAIEMILRRQSGIQKLAASAGVLAVVFVTYYFLANPDCFLSGSLTSIANSWFWGVSLLIAGLIRLTGYAFIEEIEV